MSSDKSGEEMGPEYCVLFASSSPKNGSSDLYHFFSFYRKRQEDNFSQDFSFCVIHLIAYYYQNIEKRLFSLQETLFCYLTYLFPYILCLIPKRI